MSPGLAPRMLAAWDRAANRANSARARAMLGAAAPGVAEADLHGLTVGERDRRLLDLRRALIGERLDAVADCPGCGATVEIALAVSDIMLDPTPAAPLRVNHDGWNVVARLPTAADLLAVADMRDAAAVRTALLRRCVLRAARDGSDVADPVLPAPVASAVALAMEAADPQADIELLLECPACATSAALPFDIAGFLWREVDGWASGLLADVHELASAYGWSEADILALAPSRRRLYLRMLGQ